MRSRVKPGHPSSYDHDFELAAFQVCLVDIRYFQLASRAGLERFRNSHYLVIVKIKSGHGVTRFWALGLLLDAERSPGSVKFNDSIALRVVNGISENASPRKFRRGFAQVLGEIVSVKN